MSKRLVLYLLLAISLSATAYGYYPLWVRTSFNGLANVQSIAAADFNGDTSRTWSRGATRRTRSIC